RQTVRSFLCLPIVVRARAVGALYLENTLTRQVHGARSLAILDLIASQAAISLENARLYAGLQRAQQRMVRAEQISCAGSFSGHAKSDDLEGSDEVAAIYGLTGQPTLRALRERTHPEDRALFDAILRAPAAYDGRTLELRLLLPGGSSKHLTL